MFERAGHNCLDLVRRQRQERQPAEDRADRAANIEASEPGGIGLDEGCSREAAFGSMRERRRMRPGMRIWN